MYELNRNDAGNLGPTKPLRQGDVGLVPVAVRVNRKDAEARLRQALKNGKLLESLPKVNGKPSHTIALGETSGHEHTVVADDLQVVTWQNTTWVMAPQGGEILHIDQDDAPTTDHNNLKLQPNVWYEYVQQEEYNGQQQTRRVWD